MLKQDFTFLDLETTGFLPNKDSIIEVSFVRFIDGKEVARVDQVITPDKTPLSDFVSDLTGIYQDELNNKGIPFTQISAEISDKIGDSIIIGHNIDFDINFLVANGVNIENNPRIDTHELARIFMPNESSFALEVLTDKYGFTHENAHRAMSDVLASKSLFELLIEKIAQIPADFQAQNQSFLKNKTDWFAKHLLFDIWNNSKQNNQTTTPKTSLDFQNTDETKTQTPETSKFNNPYTPQNEFSADFLHELTDFSTESTNFLKIQDSTIIQNLCINTQKHSNKKILVISPKLKFYDQLKPFPTPNVIFDRDCLENWATPKEKIDDAETTFYLKCRFRDFLGFRGLQFFDLFFKERDLWHQVCVQDSTKPSYQAIAHEKLEEDILTISPRAFLEFHELFKDRLIILDEAETLGEQILNFPSKKYYINNSLDSHEDKIANASHFFVTDFCKNIIEPKLNREIGTFPEKKLLNNDRLAQAAEQILGFDDSEMAQFAAKNLENPAEKMVRWFEYFPEKGSLNFGFWEPLDWEKTKDVFSQFNKIVLHRHSIQGDERYFSKIFLGFSRGNELQVPSTKNTPKLIIPEDIITHNSPEFNEYTARKIWEVAQQTEGNLVANFSNLDALRKTYDLLSKYNLDNNFFIAGEKVLGGDGKMLEMCKKHQSKRIILLSQKILDPNLAHLHFKTAFVQKFPFFAPSPLLEKIEQVLKNSGQSYWDLWITPQIIANISRRLGNFPELENVYFLDSRHNAPWGKYFLKDLF